MVSIRKLQGIVSLIQKDGPTNENLKHCVVVLANELIELQRELDRVNAIASRADRNSRMGSVRRY